MATSDLLAELSKDSFRAAPDVEKKVVAVVLKQLDDQSGDVSTLAVKCLPPLVRNCSAPSAVDVVHGLVERLCAEEGKDARARRDAGGIGLKTVLAEMPAAHANAGAVVKTLVPKLVATLANALSSGDAAKNTGAAGDVAGDCLDVLHAAAAGGLGAYMTAPRGGEDSGDGDGARVSPDGVSAGTARELEAALVKYLAESGRQGTRKRAATCLASLGATAGDGFLSRCAEAARERIAEAASRPAAERDELCAPYAHLLGAMAHAAGARFGKHAAASLPCVVSLAAAANEEGSEALRETCLRATERFAEECPRAVAAALPAVVAESLKLVSHDPLFGGDEGDDASGDDMDADDEALAGDGGDDARDSGSEYGSEYDASEYSDDGDDDASWKVRRGATRVLRAVSSCAPFVLEERDPSLADGKGAVLFVSLVKRLVARGFRERDESCRLEAFAALEAALRAASPSRGASSSLAAAAASVASDVALAAARWCSDAVSAKDKARDVKPTFKTRAAAFGVLRELALSVPAAFAVERKRVANASGSETRGTRDDSVGVVAEACAKALASTGGDDAAMSVSAGFAGRAFDAGSAAGVSELRVAAARFAGTVARFLDSADASAEVCARAARTLAPPLVAATRDAYYKTATEALAACEALVPAFAAALGELDDAGGVKKEALVRAATSLVSAAAEGVDAADRDAEVKAAATRCAGAACASLGGFLAFEVVSPAVESLVDRLSNEATRLGAAKALAAIFASPRSADARAASAASSRAAAELTPFLRKADRALRHASLEALGALVELPRGDKSSLLSDALVADAVAESAACVSDAEPAAAATALFLASAALRRAETLPSSAEAARSSVLPAALALVKGASASSLFGLRAGRPSTLSPGGKGVDDTLRALRNALRAFFAILTRASRFAKGTCGHAEVTALLLKAETANDAQSEKSASRDAGAAAVAECVAAACASAGGAAVAECAASLVRELESAAKTGAPPSDRSRLAMYCLGELARVPLGANGSGASGPSAFGDAKIASAFETLVRDAFGGADAGGEDASGGRRAAKKKDGKSEKKAPLPSLDESFVTAAAFALGGACAGVASRARFLPFVVAGASSGDARAEYASLVALREAVDGFERREADASELPEASRKEEEASFFTEAENASIVERLLATGERTEEEGARAVAAECLGRLAARDAYASRANGPSADASREDASKSLAGGLGLVERLRADAGDANLSAGRRAAAVAAAKHAVLHARTRATRDALIDALPGFVNPATLDASSADAATRAAATRCLSAAAHADPAAVASPDATRRAWIASVAPALFAQTRVDPSLVRVVDLGPFKHTVDDGLEHRKAAFECLATLLEAFSPRALSGAPRELVADPDGLALAPAGFAEGVAAAAARGAGDHYDVKTVAHALVCALVKSPLGLAATRAVTSDLCVAFKATLSAKLKSDAVKQEKDRAEDLARSCLRAVAAIEARTTDDPDPAFAAFVAEAVMTEKHAKLFEEARAASAETNGIARA